MCGRQSARISERPQPWRCGTELASSRGPPRAAREPDAPDPRGYSARPWITEAPQARSMSGPWRNQDWQPARGSRSEFDHQAPRLQALQPWQPEPLQPGDPTGLRVDPRGPAQDQQKWREHLSDEGDLRPLRSVQLR